MNLKILLPFQIFADKIGVPAPFLKVVFALLRARMQATVVPAA